MLAWINWEPGGLPRVRRRVELLNGMPLCRVEIGGRITPLLRLFLRRERRILREAGVRQGVWADGLPELLQLELTAVDVTPLRRAILPALLEQAFRQKRMTERTASVRLTAEGTSLPVYWAAQLLARRVRYLVIEKRMDGSYCLRGQNSVKYPEYWEMLDEAEGFAVPGGEVLVLPVDVNEVVSCARDLEKAVCAFRVTDGVVELFDKAEGLREFAALLQEALNSGKCTVPEDD